MKAGTTTESTSNSSLSTEYKSHWIANSMGLIHVTQSISSEFILLQEGFGKTLISYPTFHEIQNRMERLRGYSLKNNYWRG